ncbi:MAG TPA: hypothetical protein GX523_20425, partial [Desulfitobacterium dehalogenans]|nr:hypothetical protein [Desulfitobacterium dehalogenans]
MNEWTCELFEQDLSKMNYMQLAEWLVACRTTVQREAYDTHDAYITAMELFCLEWEDHYKQNTKVYKSEKFKKARVFTTYSDRASIKIDFGKGIERLPYDTYSSIISDNSSIWGEKALPQLERDFNELYKEILNVFAPDNRRCYKELLHDVIAKQRFCQIEVLVRAEKDDKKFKAMTYKEFLEVCHSDRTYKVITDRRSVQKNFNAALDMLGVSSSTYHEFQGERTSQKDFDKKFFVNLAFALALPYPEAERLLCYNGYTLQSEGRIFDEICRKAFTIGFSRDMAIALIDKKNTDFSKNALPYAPVPNLVSQRAKK